MTWIFSLEQRREFGRRGAAVKAAKYAATVAARFWANVDKNGPIIRPELGPCWVWTAGRFDAGYGCFRFQGRDQGAHRVAFELINGRPPVAGMLLRHDCDNPPCVRHVREGTVGDNYRDAADRGLLRIPRGEAHWNAKLTEEQVRHIRESDRTTAALATEFGVSETAVRDVRRGRRWAR